MALALGAFVPLLAFAVVSTLVLHHRERARRDHALRDTARALSLAVDRELQSQLVVLEALATSIDLDRPDFEQFRRDAARFIAAQPGWSNLMLFDRLGHEVAAAATRRPPSDDTRRLVQHVAQSGRASVSDARDLPEDSAPVITVSVPVVRDGRIRYVLGADVPAVQIGGLLRAQQLNDWLGAILDRRGNLLARSPGAETLVERSAGPELLEQLRSAHEGAFRGRTLDGVEGFMAFSRAPFTGWTVAIMVPPDTLPPSAPRSLGGLIALGLVLGGLAVALALLLGRRIATSMAKLSATARALGRGEAPATVRSGIAEVNAVAAAMEEVFEAEREARAEAETANRLKDQFLATLSHELRTPLTSMLGWIRLLRSGRLNDETAARALESVERSTRAQSQLIDDLLDVSRIVSGKLTMDVAAIDADEIVASALDAVRPLSEAKSIELTHERATRACIVQGDAGRLRQVICNLLLNAIKFTPDGGRVRAEVTVGGSEVAISVTDTGRGIAPELLPRIFERFRPGRAMRTQSGLGLGLAIVRHLVDLHGGRVGAYSDGVGRGATFVVELPLAGVASAPPRAGEGLGEFPRLDGVRVLVVDDEPDARELLGTVLEQCGAAVAAVPSAAAALEALERDRYDVMLSDISMPEEDGYQLMRKVRAVDPRLPAAAVTAFARAEDREAALAAGFQLHVAKPVEPATLARAVEYLVRRAA